MREGYSTCSVCVSVCLCVCFPYSGNQAYKQQYQRLQRDTGMKYKKGFFFNASFRSYGVVYSPRVAPASFQGSYIVPFFRRNYIRHERRRTDIRKSCSPHPLIVDCLLAPPTYFLLAYAGMRSVDSYISTC